MSHANEDVRHMRDALAQAQRGAEQGEVPVGAVVVQHGKVIARAHNAPIGSHDPTAHAEIQALRLAAQALGNYRLEDCTLYVTLEPCAMCSGAVLHARLPRVVFGAAEPRTGAAGSVLNLFDGPLNHQTQVTPGVLAEEAAQLMHDFFAKRRQTQQDRRTPLKDDALRHEDAALQSAWSCFAQDWPALSGWRLHWLDNFADHPHPQSEPAVLYLSDAPHWSFAHLASLEACLNRGEHALALDWLGFGLSDKPKKESIYSADFHARVLHDFLQRHLVREIRCPSGVAPVLHALGQVGATAITWIDSPIMPRALAQAPYPDRGHQVAQRAWRTM